MSNQIDILVRNLDIVFRRIQPEKLLHELMAWKSDWSLQDTENEMSANNIPPEMFLNAAKSSFPGFSYEERQCIYNIMFDATRPANNKKIRENKGFRIPENAAIFSLVLKASHELLTYADNRLFCRFDRVLAWDQLYRFLGQDLFTTAYLAYHDLEHGTNRHLFLWEPVLASNYFALHQDLRQGIAENHMHLGGSSQCFPIFWAYIMNHPTKIHDIDRMLSSNMQFVLLHSVNDNVETWEQRLSMAAWLRAALTMHIHGLSLWDYYIKPKILKKNEKNGKENEANILELLTKSFTLWSKLSQMIDTLRFEFGLAVPQNDDKQFVLDYALHKKLAESKLHHNRILAGERSFMYECFFRIFSRQWSAEYINAFFLYLQIKANLRTEFIQANQEVGFHNFRDYQDRKDWLYGEDPAYAREMIRLAVNGNINDYSLKCMEARFAPAKSSLALKKKIEKFDDFVKNPLPPQAKHYYVLHFIKNPDNIAQTYLEFHKTPKFITVCRNHENRWAIYHAELSVRLALERYPQLRSRLLGIDAASTEIGCPPEVFAVAFRRLRNWVPGGINQRFLDTSAMENTCKWKQGNPPFLQTDDEAPVPFVGDKPTVFQSLGVTYHAGEDFLDIVDGLRTIDEAVRFLPLKRNDRIGHALALGVSPERHYKLKEYRSVLPRQMLLDNLVWLLCRTHELDISLRSALEKKLRSKAEQLLHRLYYPEYSIKPLSDWEDEDKQNHQYKRIGNIIPYATIEDYYHGWMLRADPPRWYIDLRYRTDENEFLPRRHYEGIPEDNELEIYRENPTIARLYGMYHFSAWVREQGAICEEFHIDDEYIRLMRIVQDKMQCEIAKRGITIECNPTSNFLIGTFRDYKYHPIFRFFNINADDETDAHCLKVSINTDDLGVFDTSLENEFVMIAAALSQQIDEKGERRYSDIRIEKYLSNIRHMGLEQPFFRIQC